jgi:hypothetical protein
MFKMSKINSKFRLTPMALAIIGLGSPAVSSAAPGTLQFSAATYTTLDERDAEMTVTRTGGSDGAVSVKCDTSSGGTATAGSDYTVVSKVLNWNHLDSDSKTCTVPINDDNDNNEGTETVNLALSNPTGGATLGAPNTAVINITDDCGPGAHWIDSDINGFPCPAGTDILLHTRLDITMDGLPIILRGPTRIEREAGTTAAPTFPPSIPSSAPPLGDHHINTEMVSMVLTNNDGTITLRAGVNEGLSQRSFGKIIELAADSTIAYSYFEIFFEVDVRDDVGTLLQTLHPNGATVMAAMIKGVPPLRDSASNPVTSNQGSYRYVKVGTATFELYDEYGNLVATITVKSHITLVTLIDNSFTATASNGAVTIAWETASEIDNAGFFVWRGQLPAGKTECSKDGKDYTEVKKISPFILAQGSGTSYSHTDSQVASGNTYCYVLEDIDLMDKHTFHLDDITSASVQ